MNEDEQKDETKTAIVGGVVGTGIACAGVGFLVIATGVLTGGAAGLVIGAGLYGISSGLGKIFREGWDFQKWDEENKKFAEPGLMK